MRTYNTKIDQIHLKRKKSDFPKAKITDSKSAATYARQFYEDDITVYESFFIILLNRANITTGFVKISQGGVCGTVVDPVIVAKYAIQSLSKGVILVHNHPSDTLKPSSQDKEITTKIKNGLKLFDCNVLDHIILTDDSYFSFRDNGINC